MSADVRAMYYVIEALNEEHAALHETDDSYGCTCADCLWPQAAAMVDSMAVANRAWAQAVVNLVWWLRDE